MNLSPELPFRHPFANHGRDDVPTKIVGAIRQRRVLAQLIEQGKRELDLLGGEGEVGPQPERAREAEALHSALLSEAQLRLFYSDIWLEPDRPGPSLAAMYSRPS